MTALESELLQAKFTAALRKDLFLELVRQLAIRQLPLYPLREILEHVRTSAVTDFHALRWKQDGLDIDKITAELWRTEEYLVRQATQVASTTPSEP